MKPNDEILDIEVTRRATEVVLRTTMLVRDKRREPLIAMQHLVDLRKQLAEIDDLLVKIATEEYDGVPTELERCIGCGGREMDECRCTPEQVARYEDMLRERGDIPFGH